MNDEIKEILSFSCNADYKRLSCDEIKVLRDYITNLQQENERLKKQNELLKDQNINEILKKDLEICAKQYKKSDEKLEKYKSRIEKAVEFIENNSLYDEILDYDYEENPYISYTTDEYVKDNLLNILNGRSDE